MVIGAFKMAGRRRMAFSIGTMMAEFHKYLRIHIYNYTYTCTCTCTCICTCTYTYTCTCSISEHDAHAVKFNSLAGPDLPHWCRGRVHRQLYV